MSSSYMLQAVWRGMRNTCPGCGETHLRKGYLAIEPRCSVCGTENGAYPADDLPPYITLFIVGHIVIPAFIWSDYRYEPAMWVQFAIWLPVMVIMTLALLPVVKGGTIGLCHALGMRREAFTRHEAEKAPDAAKIVSPVGSAGH
ncbi:Zinc-finger protein [Granulibacter bethesdensis]|uniref:DUF983 domain-containing protein n=1 Tax=Granulibacter bethesdensis TaxID=364410 RepID=UPI00090C64E1|nr:DUF983 domain-containing protein [Granulibacter bethesdensis]APH57043.1 Zinc-finger protein [Granulibacter bethesdensis]